MYELEGLPVDLLEALRLISVTIRRETWVVNCSRSENFSVMVLGGAFPKTWNSQRSTLNAADIIDNMYETSRFLKVKRFTDYFEINPRKQVKHSHRILTFS